MKHWHNTGLVLGFAIVVIGSPVAVAQLSEWWIRCGVNKDAAGAIGVFVYIGILFGAGGFVVRRWRRRGE